MTAETLYKTKVKKWLDSQNIYHIPYAASMFSKSGVPDTLLCISGMFIAVEFKSEDGKVSELQKAQIWRINNAHGCAFVLYPKDFEAFKVLITSLKVEIKFETVINLRRLGNGK